MNFRVRGLFSFYKIGVINMPRGKLPSIDKYCMVFKPFKNPLNTQLTITVLDILPARLIL